MKIIVTEGLFFATIGATAFFVRIVSGHSDIAYAAAAGVTFVDMTAVHKIYC